MKGDIVNNTTVQHLVIEDKKSEIKQDHYYLCLNENCDIVYYSSNNDLAYNKNDIKVPVWFKNDANPKYVCYCNSVTEQQVIDAVLIDGAKTMKDIIRLTGAMKNGQCEIKNPSGKCCHSVVQEAINKGLKMYRD